MIGRMLMMLVLTAAGALAQVPGMFPWWDSPVARDLNLTEEQNRRVRLTVRESRPKVIQARANLETAEGELADLMNEDQVDAAKATEAIDRVIAARSELARIVSQMSLKLRLLLTPAQWRLVQQRQPNVNRPPVPVPGRRPAIPPERVPPGQLPGARNPLPEGDVY